MGLQSAVGDLDSLSLVYYQRPFLCHIDPEKVDKKKQLGLIKNFLLNFIHSDTAENDAIVY